MAVKSDLEKLGLHHTRVELGETEIMEDLSAEQLYNLNTSLKNIWLETISDQI
jgi:hypothetical protein